MVKLCSVLLVLIFATECYQTKATSTAKCLDGWTQHHQMCYNFVSKQETWIEHMQNCVAIGGHLATINDITENRYLEAEARKRHATFWVGGTNMNNNNTWIWIEDNSFVPMGPCGRGHGFCEWSRDEPDNSHGNEHCLELNIHTQWNDNYCMVLQGAICEAQPVPEGHWITLG
ncbi:lactose-binding lectin l-2-like [Pecten maximus]|uniref:lactose-binding lectin l-2-like n=1 Tax=Pecten maximus TaxID=6579 RepID=UPI001457E7E6|nr:lactose-binding lectin l-2-like [Pecten maximus]